MHVEHRHARPFKVGKLRIGLGDQLYESKNATGEVKPQQTKADGAREAA